METSRCKAFLAAVDTGSFTKAAEALSYTPSGVSQLVSALENDLGFALLHREKRGVTLTENGEYMLPHIREFIRQEELLYQISADINGMTIGSITIGSYPSIATHWLPRVIKSFQTEYPQIEINLMEGTSQEICAWLDEKRVELAFMSYFDTMKYEFIPLGEDRMLAVLPPDHPMAKEKVYPLKECVNEQLIMSDFGKDVDTTAMMKAQGIKPNIRFTTIENMSELAMIEQGLGVGIMNELITYKMDFNVVKLPIDPPYKITFGLAANSFEKLSPAANKFIEYAVKMLTRKQE